MVLKTDNAAWQISLRWKTRQRQTTTTKRKTLKYPRLALKSRVIHLFPRKPAITWPWTGVVINNIMLTSPRWMIMGLDPCLALKSWRLSCSHTAAGAAAAESASGEVAYHLCAGVRPLPDRLMDAGRHRSRKELHLSATRSGAKSHAARSSIRLSARPRGECYTGSVPYTQQRANMARKHSAGWCGEC